MLEKKLSREQMEILQKSETKEEVEKLDKENQLNDEKLEKATGGMPSTTIDAPPLYLED